MVGASAIEMYFKHSWLLCKIDRKFQLFSDKPVRGDPRAIRSNTYYLRINAITHVDRARRRRRQRFEYRGPVSFFDNGPDKRGLTVV